jgi:MFS family permease
MSNIVTNHDPYTSLRHRDFRLLMAGRFLTSFAMEMLTFAVSWELWLRTHSAYALGLVGLVQVIPVILLSLPAGHVADQYDRKRIVMMAESLLAVCAFGLGWLSYTQGSLVLIYIFLLGIGVGRAFHEPASSTLIPQTVPAEKYSNAAMWNSGIWQVASISGPTIAGLYVGFFKSVSLIYIFDGFAALIFCVLLIFIKGKPIALARKADTLDSLREGLQFMGRTRIILAAITLDMFAVLFGGAVALLPIFATDILKVGADGLGVLRAAPSVGAVLMALSLTQFPPMKKAGQTLLIVVAGFGIATIIFGLSKSFYLSVFMLAVMGCLDNVSVVIRGTLLLTHTPDEMRGRVSAVNNVFIGISNELGGFESGLVAGLIGPVAAVVVGGIGTLIVVLVTTEYFPELRNLKSLDAPTE